MNHLVSWSIYLNLDDGSVLNLEILNKSREGAIIDSLYRVENRCPKKKILSVLSKPLNYR
jgi:hypothetical protein